MWAREPFLRKGEGRKEGRTETNGQRNREREISFVHRGEGIDEEAGVMRRRWDIYAAES